MAKRPLDSSLDKCFNLIKLQKERRQLEGFRAIFLGIAPVKPSNSG